MSNSAKAFYKNTEKILIGAILFSIVLFYISTGKQELKDSLAFPIVLTLEIALLLFYLNQTRALLGLFFLGFITWNIGFLLAKENPSVSYSLILIGEVSQALLGLYFGYKTIKDSSANKDWEMYGTLISLELLFPLIYRYTLPGKEFLMIYFFALPFVLGIVMFNDNLWEKYSASEKKILTYILIASIAEVLFISVKLF